MAFTAVFEGVVFVEGDFQGAVRGESIKTDLTGFYAQMKSLRDVKHDLAQKAKQKGYNAVLNFEYGQKSSMFSLDDVKFSGKGVLAKIPQHDYERVCNTP